MSQLTHSADRRSGLVVWFALLVTWLCQVSVGWALTVGAALEISKRVLGIAEWIFGCFFGLLVCLVLVAIVCGRIRLAKTITAVYVGCAILQLLLFLSLLVLDSSAKQGQPLVTLWDIALFFALDTLVFGNVYWAFDITSSGGAFLFPTSANASDNQPPKHGFFDYLFISFNTNLTFGPTTETPLRRRAKFLMMLQATISLVLITVVIARLVGGH